MKEIDVAAAIIGDKDRILAVMRGYGEFEGLFEFPGGKIEAGESIEVALRREIKEELDADIKIDKHYLNYSYSYPSFKVNLNFFICSFHELKVVLKEHKEARWISKSEIEELNWLEGEKEVLNKLKREWI